MGITSSRSLRRKLLFCFRILFRLHDNFKACHKHRHETCILSLSKIFFHSTLNDNRSKADFFRTKYLSQKQSPAFPPKHIAYHFTLLITTPQPAHFKLPHTHNQPKQHTSEAKTAYTTTKQQTKQSLNQKTNPADNQKDVAQQKPTTTQKEP